MVGQELEDEVVCKYNGDLIAPGLKVSGER